MLKYWVMSILSSAPFIFLTSYFPTHTFWFSIGFTGVIVCAALAIVLWIYTLVVSYPQD